MTKPAAAPRTTKFTKTITTIADVVALEQSPYDELIPARNLYHVFQATAHLHGERPALTVLAAGDPQENTVTLSHAELLDAITRAANVFRSLGITPTSGAVAFLCPALPQVPAALIGAQVAGVASSINFLLNADAIADLLIAENATVLVIPSAAHDAALWEKANAVIDRVPSLQHVLVIGGESDPARKLASFDETQSAQRATLDFQLAAEGDTVCALFHTGGTTGRPKLVRLTHGNQIHAAWSFAQVHGLDESDVAINGFPLFHVGGTVTAGLSILAAGGHMIIPSAYSLRLPRVIENYWGIVERFRATIVSGVPTSIAALAEVPIGKRNVASVRMALTGGAVCPKAVSERFEARTGMRLFETYGMTETAAAIAFNPGRGVPLAGSVGFRAPYAKTLIAAFGSEDDNPKACAPLTSGLVFVQGPQVFPGYVDPKHNAGVLSDAGWLITGDIGYLTEDERLVLTGRAKDLIVRSGHNIDPAAIEDVANDFPGVQISSAVGMPDQYAGEVPILFVVPAPGQTIDLPGLQMHIERTIMEPPAKPKRVVVLDALPVTAVGKIFKPALRDLAIREKAKLEIERVFGEGANADITVEQDDKLNTRIRIVVDTADSARLRTLSESLESLPQSYRVEGRAAQSGPGDDVILERTDGIAVVTLNRPNALNALSHGVMHALDGVLDELAADATLRAVIVTGAGRAFSAGGDLLEFHEKLHDSPQQLIETLAFNQRVFAKLEALPVPVIGAVNGTAVAGGLELLLCCDVLIAAEDAKLGDGHAKYAVVPAGGATVRLFRKIPPNRAMQLFFSAALVSARELCDWGLINEVVPAPLVLARAKEVASRFCRQSPEVLAHIKDLARAYFGASPHDGFQAEIAAFAKHIGGKDLAEGLAAYRNKRRPRY
jgi:acyl-CoA synthetase (AMP-forming)/AMP-acid ligase II/enoyl-CoA hydratase/carnithine racemase